ncbi:hypothetical protein MUO14_18940 [Halobacillus shinanisalinarum]|uniref:Voltage-gated potassium channel n=1 Tax=Halobacillus shinanisalinarum TaxID=2932258 RepID=A0ABY4GX52_9BACI|nr:hypothetical protein [Halobacillus shinanisalinarum]UOQ92505.1 hypothetical protein MUO14_18940 [Halobacillus shinanisalinarum]
MKLFKRKPTRTVYELLMVGLATLSVATIWQQTRYDSYLVWITWSIFFIDFLYRLFTSDRKWSFVKRNPFIVIAAIPLDAAFQFARFARILHLLRLKSITKYYTKPLIRFLQRQHLSLVAGTTFFLIFLLIIPLNLYEDKLTSYNEAFLSTLTALTFFGKTGFEPQTTIGQVIIVIFTILGVIIHGLIISTVIDYLIQLPVVQKFKKRFGNSSNTEEMREKES